MKREKEKKMFPTICAWIGIALIVLWAAGQMANIDYMSRHFREIAVDKKTPPEWTKVNSSLVIVCGSASILLYLAILLADFNLLMLDSILILILVYIWSNKKMKLIKEITIDKIIPPEWTKVNSSLVIVCGLASILLYLVIPVANLLYMLAPILVLVLVYIWSNKKLFEGVKIDPEAVASLIEADPKKAFLQSSSLMMISALARALPFIIYLIRR